jgi:prepilin-type N-terminal cleavage/methylation domain-containing protein
MKTKGFTLVELLIVIAIIGILSSVVISNLGESRSQANDAKIQSQLSNIRGSAELYFISNGSYGSTNYSCTGGMFSDTTSGMSELAKVSNYPDGTNLICNSNSTSWAVQGSLASTTTYWCVDKGGTSKEKSTSIASSTSCA